MQTNKKKKKAGALSWRRKNSKEQRMINSGSISNFPLFLP